MPVGNPWSDSQVDEAVETLIAVYGDQAIQRLIDITQAEIRETGQCDIPHDAIVARITSRLSEIRP
jgi:hypothetical protein